MTKLTNLRRGKGVSSVPNRRSLAIAQRAPDLLLLFAANIGSLVNSLIAARITALCVLLVLPGACVLALTQLRPARSAMRLAWSAGMSVLILMALGLLFSVTLPHLGVHRPLESTPLLIGIDVVVAGAIMGSRSGSGTSYLFGGLVLRPRPVLFSALLALLPVAAIAGAERLNNHLGNALAVGTLVCSGLALVVLALAADMLPAWSLSVVLYMATAATLYASSMRSNYPFGSDVHEEYHVYAVTAHAALWSAATHGNAYAAMLSITVLPAVLSAVTHISGTYLFKTVYVALFSLFPVIVYCVASERYPRRAAIIGPVVVVSQGFYAADIDALNRQDIGLLFFALLIAAVSDYKLSRRTRQIAVLTASAGMAVSHYSTAYFAALVILLGYLVMTVTRLARSRRLPAPILSLPVVGGIILLIALWNIVITRTATNITNVAHNVREQGLQIIPPTGGSLINRYLQSDIARTVSVRKFEMLATSYYTRHDPWIRRYPTAVVRRFPVRPASVTGQSSHVPAAVGSAISNSSTALDQVLLLALVVGAVTLLWRHRGRKVSDLSELAALSVGALAVLAILRLSASVALYYNAPRGQVQAAVVLSVGLSLVCKALFGSRKAGSIAVILVSLGVAVLFVTNSGLLGVVAGGEVTDVLANSGESYQRFYISDADVATASWLAEQYQRSGGGVVYSDIYGRLAIEQVSSIPVNVNTLLPSVADQNAYVFASAANIEDGTARAEIGSSYLTFVFPKAFYQAVDNTIFATSSTEIYQ